MYPFSTSGNPDTEIAMDDDVDEYSKLHSVQGVYDLEIMKVSYKRVQFIIRSDATLSILERVFYDYNRNDIRFPLLCFYFALPLHALPLSLTP